MLIVAPKGSTKLVISFLAPSFWLHSMFSGSAPTELDEENAIVIAGSIPLKNASGDILAIVFVVKENTTAIWKIYAR